MALIYCPECGTSVSDKAQACPKCAYPVNSARTDVRETFEKGTYISEPPVREETHASQTIFIQSEKRQTNGLGTAGFILALVALVLSWVPGVGWIVWFLGFILSFLGMFKNPKGLAVTGFLLSLIDLILLIVVIGGIVSIFEGLFLFK